MDTIGTRLEAERARLEMNQIDFAKHIKLPQSTYNEYKSGKKTMNVDAFFSVCSELGWAPEYLYYGSGVKMSDARTHHEAELLNLLRALPPEQHETVIGMVKVAVDGLIKANESA